MATGFQSLLPQSLVANQNNSLQQLFQQTVGQSRQREAELQRQRQQLLEQQQNQGLLGNLLQNITSPIRTIGEGARTFAAAAGGGDVTSPEFQLQSLLTQEELQRAGERPGEAFLGETAKAASFLVPGLSGLGSIQGAALSGALQGIGETEDFSDVGQLTQNIVGGAALGGITQGVFDKVLPLAGRSLKGFGQKLNQAAEGRELAAIRTAVGKTPTGKLKGSLPKIANAAKQYNITINSADDVARLSDDIFSDLGNVITQRSEQLANQGITANVDEIIKPLQASLDETLTPQLRRPVEQVIETIRTIAPDGTINPSQLYRLKQEFGRLGKFNPMVTNEAKTMAEVFERAYGSASNELDRIFKQAGYDDLGDINELLEAAIKGEQWIKQSTGMAPSQSVTDLLQDSAIFGAIATGSPIGAIPAMAANRLLVSPAGERAVGVGLGKLGSGASQLGNILENIQVPGAVPGAGAAALAFAQPEGTGQDIEIEQAAMDGELFEQDIVGTSQQADPMFWISQGVKVTDAVKLAEFYGGQGGKEGTPLTRQQRSLVLEANQAVKELDRLLKKDEGLLLQTATTPMFLQGADAQRVNATRSQIEETIGRLNSGGAITDDEAARFAAFVPQFGDRPETIKYKMDTLRARFDELL